MKLLPIASLSRPLPQHLWEAHVCDFVAEVMGGVPFVIAGNSIGGGIASGVASNLRELCCGLVLCNSAGVLQEPEDYVRPSVSVGRQTALGQLPKAYSPLPLVGQRGLDCFGEVVISAIFPSIPARLADIYSERPQNADARLAFAIEQGAAFPGSANVIGSGQKLPPQRPLNEVLDTVDGFAGPVLVPQGRNDRVSGAELAQSRAATLARLRPGVSVQLIDGGHCVQDDSPEAVAAAVLQWLPETKAWAASMALGTP